MHASTLEDLLSAAVVRIDIDGRISGTGFFVGRGHVLTCAHVIESATLALSTSSLGASTPEINVTDAWNRSYKVTDPPIADSHTDLAWLRLPMAPVDVPIAVLHSDVTFGDKLQTYGFPSLKPEGVPVTFTSEGRAGGTPPLIKFQGGQVQPGMSGAPLLNLRTGGVCGILSRTRDEMQALGGYGISVEAVEGSDFYRDLQTHITSAHQVESEWLAHLTPGQLKYVLQPAGKAKQPSSAVEFIVNVRQYANGWKVNATVFPSGNQLRPVKVDLNVVRAEVARLFRAWKSQDRIKEPEQARLLGQVLYRAVLPEVIAKELEHYLFESPDEQVNVNLHFAEGTAQDLVHLSWEQLYAPEKETRGGIAIGMNDKATLTRVLSVEPLGYDAPAVQNLRVLLIEAPSSPEASDAAAAVSQFLKEHEIEVVHKHQITPDCLRETISDGPFTILHYVGYGRYHGEVDELALSNDDGDIEWQDPTDFAALLRSSPPKLVVLQACNTTTRNVVPGDLTVLAKSLLQSQVQAVVACQFPMPNSRIARRRVELLYIELVQGSPVRLAVQNVRKQLTVQPWAQPALFARNPGDLRLVARTRSARRESGPWMGGTHG